MVATSGGADRDEAGPRVRMVRTTAQLIRRQGVSGTGLREVLAEADAPRGSLAHYFPGGKTQLISEALLMMGGVAARRVGRAMRESESANPSALLEAMVDHWRHDLTAEGFIAGCPLVAAASDSAADSEPIRRVIAEAFEAWQQPLTAGLIGLGITEERAPRLSLLVLSALEGAIVLARVRQQLEPLDAVAAELGPLLDAALPTRKGTRR